MPPLLLFADEPITWQSALTVITTTIMVVLLKWIDSRSVNRVNDIKKDVTEVKQTVNGMSDKRAASSLAQGNAEGRIEERRESEERKQ